jgi:hypothetical protein
MKKDRIQLMTIDNTTGFVDIGLPFTPDQLPTLNSGDINIQDFIIPTIQNNAYRIGNVRTLWRGQNGILTNIFVGANAGNANTTGFWGTFVGAFAGFNNTTAPDNTFVGFRSGFSTTSALGRANTFVGAMCGSNNTRGGLNTFLGDEAMNFNTTGNANISIGIFSGLNNVTGDSNIVIGPFANLSASNFFNTIVIGSHATVTASNKMILGNNHIWVGIGLSNDGSPNFGPQSSLEINARVNGTGAIIPNWSGLKFRQLNSNSPLLPNPGTGVLSLDATGNVIYVTPGGTNVFGNGSSSASGPNTLVYGGRFVAQNGVLNYGIHATAPMGGSSYAVYSNDDLYINGVGTGSNGIFYTSDAMFKTNIDTISNAGQIISQLLPKQFYFDTTNSYNIRFSSKKQYGLVAQDIENVLPELVSYSTKPAEFDSVGNQIYPSVVYKTLNYNALLGILIKGMQEQQSLIDSLFATQNNVRLSNSSANNLNVDLVSDIVLYQNMPNPFGENTIIKYYLPSSITTAVMNFMDETSRIIKEVQLTQTGDGQIIINAQDLANGIYTYSLYVNGKNV